VFILFSNLIIYCSPLFIFFSISSHLWKRSLLSLYSVYKGNKSGSNKSIYNSYFSKILFISVSSKFILEIDSSLLSLITNPLLTNSVNGFPSLFIIKNKQVSHYNNERTAFEFMKFFKSNIVKSQNKNKNKNKKYNKYKSYKNKTKLYKNKYYPKSFNKTLKK
jgi:hypothetical protein